MEQQKFKLGVNAFCLVWMDSSLLFIPQLLRFLVSCCPVYCGKIVKYRFIEFFVFHYDFLPYLLSLFFCWRVTYPIA